MRAVAQAVPWIIAVGTLPLMLWLRRRQRQGPGRMAAWRPRTGRMAAWRPRTGRMAAWRPRTGQAMAWPRAAGLVAAREVRERIRGRVFRAATLLLLAVVAVAIVAPSLAAGAYPRRAGAAGTVPVGGSAGVPAAVGGLILVWLMLTQYDTWTLIGVMEEKAGRVAEVLLAAVRPGPFLAGKVLGIAAVAGTQATVVAGFAAGLSHAVGSDPLRGATPATLVGTLVWLVLGYGFHSWLHAAAGAMAERRDQVQSLVLPLALPLVAALLVCQAALAAGRPSTALEVLAYLPPTAPLAMPVLAGFGAVTWWQFTASAALSLLCTVLVARLATGIYRRAILRTGRRVPLREVLPPGRGRVAEHGR